MGGGVTPRSVDQNHLTILHIPPPLIYPPPGKTQIYALMSMIICAHLFFSIFLLCFIFFFAQQLSRRSNGWFSENNFLSCFFCNQLFCKWNKECLVSDFVTQTILTSHFVEWNKSYLLSLLKLCCCKLTCE